MKHENWATEDFAKALDTTGYISWCYLGEYWYLKREANRAGNLHWKAYRIDWSGKPLDVQERTDHEAFCLFLEHFKRWCEARGIYVIPSMSGNGKHVYRSYKVENGHAAHLIKGKFQELRKKPSEFSCELTAFITSVIAQGKD